MVKFNSMLDYLEAVTSAVQIGFLAPNLLSRKMIPAWELNELIMAENKDRGPIHRIKFKAEDLFQKIVPIVKSLHYKEKIVVMHLLIPERRDDSNIITEAIHWAKNQVEDPDNELYQWSIIGTTSFILIAKIFLWIVRKCCRKEHPTFLEDKNLLGKNKVPMKRRWEKLQRL